MPDTLTLTDNRTGLTYEVPIEDGAVRANALRQIKVDEADFGLMSYDPAFLNTASCRSAITFIDGDAGILRYRGYPIDQLAVESTYLETAFLLLFGELPTKDEMARFEHEITYHTFVHENVKTLMTGFRYDAHPMGMFVSVVAALGTLYPEASKVDDPDVRLAQVIRLIAKVPTIAAWSYRHNKGLPYVYPDNDLGFAENFLSMMFKMAESKYSPDPALVRALEVLFILHADHEQNCSANAMRAIGSSKVDPYSALAGAAAALYGPLHGGANEAVLRMLVSIGDVKNVPAFVEQFCSWSAWRMNSTSSARTSAGSGEYFASAILNIIARKFSANERSLSGYTYGMPLLWRYDHAEIVGTFAISRITCASRTSGSSTFDASG